MRDHQPSTIAAQAVFGDTGAKAYTELGSEYVSTLSAPLDDMWAAFADAAEPAALVLDDTVVGCASVDGGGDLQRFFVQPGNEHSASELLLAVRRERPVTAVIAPTTDPLVLSVALPHCTSASTVALLYHHATAPTGDRLDSLRLATESDHTAVVQFVNESTGGPTEFVDSYTAARIHRGELFLHELGTEIVGLGERRLDERSPGHAHLGIIVGRNHRRVGLGSRLMNTLVGICAGEPLIPLCSTEPDNTAAQRLIRSAGFRSRHTIFRLRLDLGEDLTTTPAHES